MAAYPQENYKQMLIKLLPPGKIWIAPPGSNLEKLLNIRAKELETIDTRVNDLPTECIPNTTTELLEDWEVVCGLPEPCMARSGLTYTVDERRKMVLSKLVGHYNYAHFKVGRNAVGEPLAWPIREGSLSPSFLLAIIKELGFTEVTIKELHDFKVGHSTVGEPLTNGIWNHVFQINKVGAYRKWFRVGTNTVGERLVEYGNISLQCVVRQHRPAHTDTVYNLYAFYIP